MTIDRDEQLAWQVLNQALNGNPGDKLAESVGMAIGEMREDLDYEDGIHELADGCVPVYTYERMQMLAESIHYATWEPELAQPGSDPVTLAGIVLYEIASRALHIAHAHLIEERDEAEEEAEEEAEFERAAFAESEGE